MLHNKFNYPIRDAELINIQHMIRLNFWYDTPLNTKVKDIPEVIELSDPNGKFFKEDEFLLNKYKENEKKVLFPDLLDDWIFVRAYKAEYMDHQDDSPDEMSQKSSFNFTFQTKPSKKLNDEVNAFLFRKFDIFVIFYRSTDSLIDAFSDINIGLFKKMDESLINSFRMARHMFILGSYVGVKDFILVGHSMGGCMAQFAYASSYRKMVLENGFNVTCKTYNALGIGRDIEDFPNFNSLDFDLPNRDKIVKDLEAFALDLDNKSINYDYFNDSRRLETTSAIRKIILFNIDVEQRLGVVAFFSKPSSIFKNLVYKLGFGREKTPEEKVQQIPYDPVKIDHIARYAYFAILCKGNMQSFLGKMKDLESYRGCYHYHIPSDWTTKQRRELGINVDITRKDSYESLDRTVTTPFSLIITAIKEIGFECHGLNNFLLYLGDDGDLKPGKMRKSMLRNAFARYVDQKTTVLSFNISDAKKAYFEDLFYMRSYKMAQYFVSAAKTSDYPLFTYNKNNGTYEFGSYTNLSNPLYGCYHFQQGIETTEKGTLIPWKKYLHT